MPSARSPPGPAGEKRDVLLPDQAVEEVHPDVDPRLRAVVGPASEARVHGDDDSPSPFGIEEIVVGLDAVDLLLAHVVRIPMDVDRVEVDAEALGYGELREPVGVDRHVAVVLASVLDDVRADQQGPDWLGRVRRHEHVHRVASRVGHVDGVPPVGALCQYPFPVGGAAPGARDDLNVELFGEVVVDVEAPPASRTAEGKHDLAFLLGRGDQLVPSRLKGHVGSRRWRNSSRRRWSGGAGRQRGGRRRRGGSGRRGWRRRWRRGRRRSRVLAAAGGEQTAERQGDDGPRPHDPSS